VTNIEEDASTQADFAITSDDFESEFAAAGLSMSDDALASPTEPSAAVAAAAAAAAAPAAATEDPTGASEESEHAEWQHAGGAAVVATANEDVWAAMEAAADGDAPVDLPPTLPVRPPLPPHRHK
jgi:hypothetical protein